MPPLDPEPTILDSPSGLWWYEVTEVYGSAITKQIVPGDRLISPWRGRQARFPTYDLHKDKATGELYASVERRVTDEERGALRRTGLYHTLEVRS